MTCEGFAQPTPIVGMYGNRHQIEEYVAKFGQNFSIFGRKTYIENNRILDKKCKENLIKVFVSFELPTMPCIVTLRNKILQPL